MIGFLVYMIVGLVVAMILFNYIPVDDTSESPMVTVAMTLVTVLWPVFLVLGALVFIFMKLKKIW